MAKKGTVLYNGTPAGLLEKDEHGYSFQYFQAYLDDSSTRAISITLPKSKVPYRSNHLFPFFSNLLSEGMNKKIQCQKLRIDEHDYFELLLQTTQEETIGAVTVKPIKDDA